MNFDEKKDRLAMVDERILLPDGFEDALIGYGEQYTKTFAIYDRPKCIQILMDRDKMTFEDAVEFFEFNVIGAFVGECTPCFATLFEPEQPQKEETAPISRTQADTESDVAGSEGEDNEE
jgi:hypothetical protein